MGYNKYNRRNFLRDSTILTAGIPFLSDTGASPDDRQVEHLKEFTNPVPNADIPSAEIRMVEGNPELFINGQQTSRMLGRLSCPGEWSPEKIEQYKGSGINIFLTDVDLETTLCWDGEDGYDYRLYEWHLEKILDVNPDIFLIPYVGTAGCAPYKWNRKHEDQLPLLSNGDRLRIPSLASDRWLEDSSEALRRFVKHFQGSRFAPHIVGYNVIQWSNEWHTPTSRNKPPLDDYSQPMLQKFRAWLRAKYDNDVALLRSRWKDAKVTFDTAEIPSEEKRLQFTGFFSERDNGSQVNDYLKCFNDTKSDFIIAQCRAVKEASAKPTLTCLSRVGDRKMMESEWIDINHGPYHYADRKLAHISGYPKASYKLYKKLHIDQIDTGTHLLPKTGGDPLGIYGIWPGPFRLADNMEDSLNLLKRDVAFSIGLNGTLYWNEGGPGWMFPIISHGVTTWGRFWYDTPEMNQLIIQTKKLIDKNRDQKAESVAEVAVFNSEEGTPGVSGRVFGKSSSTITMLALSGVPYHTYAIEDFDLIRDKYKVYIFQGNHFISRKMHKIIKDKLAADNATAIWFYSSGLLDESGIDLKNMEALMGMRFGMEETKGPVQVRLSNGSHSMLKGLEGITEFGSKTIHERNNSDQSIPDTGFEPETLSVDMPALLWCADDKATVLGTIEGTDKPGLALMKNNNATHIWSAAPQIPWQLLGNMFREAGVHVYGQTGDQVFVNSRFAGMYCITSGEKVLSLPKAARVSDAFSGEVIASKTDTIRFNAKAGETRCFTFS
jgi:hypothetical protein